MALLQARRGLFKQERTYQRVVALALAELFVFARHTVTQLLLVGCRTSGLTHAPTVPTGSALVAQYAVVGLSHCFLAAA